MKYFTVAQKSYLINMSYKLDLLGNIVNTAVSILVNIAVWNAIYNEDPTFDGFQFNIILTYVILSLSISSVFVMDDYFIEKRIRNGAISNDLTKPLNFFAYIFYYNFGITLFKITVILIPSISIFCLFFHLLPPFSGPYFLVFLISLVLGYLVMFCLNFIVWMSAFWIKRIFSLVTFKDVTVLILSGAIIPLWFMPEWLLNVIRWLPFDSILYTPILIYLGQVPVFELYFLLLKQLSWLMVLFLICMILWRFAVRKLDVQGG